MNLTNEQKSLLVGTWKTGDFTWLYKIGAAIYCQIFDLDPSVKQLFSFVAECEKQQEDYKESKQFRAQALRFVQVLDNAMNVIEHHLDDADFDDILYQLGRRHQTLASIGFKSDYWNIFEDAVVKVMEAEYHTHYEHLTECDKVAAVDAWKVVSDYIITGMKRGFDDRIPTLSPRIS